MTEQLMQKMIKIIDAELKDVDDELIRIDDMRHRKNILLMEKVELLRARREIERELHGKREKAGSEKMLYSFTGG